MNRNRFSNGDAQALIPTSWVDLPCCDWTAWCGQDRCLAPRYATSSYANNNLASLVNYLFFRMDDCGSYGCAAIVPERRF